MFDKVVNGDRFVNYSNGSQNLKTGYKKYKPLSVFLQPNAGDDFTGVHRYFRLQCPNRSATIFVVKQ